MNNVELGYHTGYREGPNFGVHAGCSVATVAEGVTPTSSWVVMTLEIMPTGNSPNNVKIYTNGIPQPVVSDNGGWPRAGGYPFEQSVPLFVGARVAYGDGYHHGLLGDVIIVNTTLDAAKRSSVESWLIQQYVTS